MLLLEAITPAADTFGLGVTLYELNWSSERGQDQKNPDTSAIMQPIAHNLTKAQFQPSRLISIIWSNFFIFVQILSGMAT